MTEIERRKTTGLTVLGVFCVVLGAVWVIGAFWALLQPDTLAKWTKQSGAPELLTRLSVAWTYVDAGLNLVLAALLFAAGVGLLRLRAWGAKLGIAYAAARIVLSVLSFVFALVGPIAHRPGPQQLQGAREAKLVEFMSNMFMPIAVTEVVASLVLSVVFAVILLCLLSRPSYKARLS